MLEVEGLSVSYGAVRALEDVTLGAAAGSTTAVLGANGAGKSSLLRAISGIAPASAGRIRLEGRDVTALTPGHWHWSGWLTPKGRVVALEPERAPTLFRAREAGMPVDVEVGGIAADSLGARRIGALSWDIVQQHLHEALLLDDAAIRAAQSWLWRELKLAVEPAAALPLAALQTGAYVPRPGEKICLIVCGANVDPATLG